MSDEIVLGTIEYGGNNGDERRPSISILKLNVTFNQIYHRTRYTGYNPRMDSTIGKSAGR